MRVVVAGGGAVGAQLAALLHAGGHEVAMVEVATARAAGLTARAAPGGAGAPVEVVTGNACVAEVLEAAGALRADALVACTGDDAENLVIAEVAKRHLEVPLVLARLNDEANRWLFGAAWGVDVAISPASALAAGLEAAAGEPVGRVAPGEVNRPGSGSASR